jgi:transposase-like protein
MVRQRRKSRFLSSIERRLLEQFAAGVSVRTAAELVGVSHNTAILYFHHKSRAHKTTISRNIARNSPLWGYRPKQASFLAE